jgi:glycine/sarcosine N-methyltransferase
MARRERYPAGQERIPEDRYEGFADRYDLFFGDFEAYSPGLVDFFKKVFEQEGVQRILDCACGTGRHVNLFHNLGYQVVGSDISPSMLAQAEKNLRARGIEAPLLKIDYRRLPDHFGSEFDAVVCLTSAICEMAGPDEILEAFRSMISVLRGGGILILSQGTTDKQWREKPRFILVDDDEDLTRLFVIDYAGGGARYNVVDIFHRDDAAEVKSWSIDYPCIVLRDGQEELLKSAGFKSVDFYGSYDFEDYSKETSSHLITVAHA